MLSVEDGRVIQQIEIRDDFAEGIAIVGSEVFQVSWKSGLARVFRLSDLKLLRTYRYDGEGWGLAAYGDYLLMSNGSHVLSVRRPDDFCCASQIHVRSWGLPIHWLNDLEFAHGLIYANVWKMDRIVMVAPQTGRLVGVVDCRRLIQEVGTSADPEAVLNGIAYNAINGTFFLTGKNWPTIFEVDIPFP